MLQLPAPIDHVTCSRGHSAALDSEHHVWVFTSWGRPCRLTSPAINSQAKEHHAVQVEAGWTFVSILTEAGSVYVIWPFSHEFDVQNREENRKLDQKYAKVKAKNGIIPCVPIDIDAEPLALPDIPCDLPDLVARCDEDQERSKPRLVRIAAGDHFVIGLTDQGHVLSIDLSGEGTFSVAYPWLRDAFVRGQRAWQYVRALDGDIHTLIKLFEQCSFQNSAI